MAAVHAAAVVTDPFLFQRIVSFQRGLPHDLVELARSKAKYSPLAYYAINNGDVRLLQRVFRFYREQPAYCRSQPALPFHGAWRHAVQQNQLAIAQWLDAQPMLLCAATLDEIWEAAITSESIEMLAYVLARRPELAQSFTSKQVTQLAASGSLEMLAWLEAKVRDSGSMPYSAVAVRSAVTHGHLAMVRHLHDTFHGDWTSVARDALDRHSMVVDDTYLRSPMEIAAAKGHLDIVTFLHKHRTDPCSTTAMDVAARRGHLDIVRFLHEHRTEGCTTKAMDGAATNGHLSVVTFLQEHRTEGCTTKAMDGAACHGHLDVLQYLHAHRRDGCSPAATINAARGGHLAIIQFLHEHNCVPEKPATVLDTAASSGHLDVVRFLHENRSEACTTDALDKAAANGHEAIVRFLHEHRSEGGTLHAVDKAAEHGYLEVVQFLMTHRTEGCTAHAVDQAAVQSHLDVVRYLLDAHAAVFTGKAVEAAIQHDWKDVTQALLARDPLMCTPEALRLAAERGDLALTQQLFSLAPSVHPWTSTDAAVHGHTSIVQFLFERVPRCRHEHAMVAAARGGHVATVRFLHEHYHAHCTPSALFEAVKHGHLDVIQYLFTNCPASVATTKLLVRAALSGDIAVVRFVLDHFPLDRSVTEAREVARRREFGDIVALLDDVVATEMEVAGGSER